MAGKFTKEVRQNVVNALAAGNYQATAAALAGVSYQTLRRWLVKGEEEASGEYRSFKEACDRATAQSEAGMIGVITTAAADGDAKVALEFLARRFPDKWSQTNKVMVAVEKNLEEMLDYLETKLTKETYNEVILALAEFEGMGKSNDG